MGAPLLMEKQCVKCAVLKPISQFGRHRIQKDGLNCRCRDCCRAQRAEFYAANPETCRAAARAYYRDNREKCRQWNREWISANRERRAEKKRINRAESPAATLHHRVSASLSRSLRAGKGGRKTAGIVGWTVAELKAHLERQFLRGMGWENMGQWHIDHIVPLSSFTITGPDDPEVRRAWALTNLRPLWAKDNLAKSDKRETLL